MPHSVNSLWWKSFPVIFSSFLEQKASTAWRGYSSNRCTLILYSWGCELRSPFCHHRNRRASQSFDLTRTWWNMASMSDMMAIGSCPKPVKTLTSGFVRSGPCSNWSLRERPRYLKTTRTFPGLAGSTTAWWGRYHVFPEVDAGGADVAYPFSSRSSILVALVVQIHTAF